MRPWIRSLYKAKPERAVAQGQLAVYSGRASQKKLYKAKAQRAVAGGQLAVYSSGGFVEEGRQRRRGEEEKDGRSVEI